MKTAKLRNKRTKNPPNVTHMTDGVNSADFLVPKQPQPPGETGGWSDWAWLTGGCLRCTLPARGLILPPQPCRFPCSRLLTGSRKHRGLTVSCPGSPALGLMTPTALCWQLRNIRLSGKSFSGFTDPLLRFPLRQFHGTLSRLSHFLPELIFPSSSSAAARHLALHRRTTVRLPRRCEHFSPWRLQGAALTNWTALSLRAAQASADSGPEMSLNC